MSNSSTNPQLIFPKLKSGTTLTRFSADEIFIGFGQIRFGHKGGTLPLHPYLGLLRRCDGRTSLAELLELAVKSELSPNDFSALIGDLEREQLIEIHSRLQGSVGRDESLVQQHERIAPEMKLLTWRDGVGDGGISELEKRSTYSIQIFGESRLARTLLSLLQATGFTQSRILLRPDFDSERIRGSDVCGLVTRADDIGKSRIDFHNEITRTSALLPSQKGLFKIPSLVISAIPIPADLLQLWLSEGTPHLQIGALVGNRVEIGPFVIPGVSPCVQCARLAERDSLPDFLARSITPYQFAELPSAGVAIIAGVVASVVAQFCATSTTSLIAHSASIDLLSPLDQMKFTELDFHNECGCTDRWRARVS